MVRVSSSLSLFVSVAAAAYPTFTIPAFDLNTIDWAATHRLVSSLEANGIVAFQGIPHLATIRRDVLHSATACASSESDLTQFKLLQDGTERRTFSADTRGLPTDIADRCPDYKHAHAAYTKLMDATLAQFGRVLDGSTASSNHTDSLEAMAATGSHLIHNHLYSNPESNTATQEFSFQLHTDRGLGLLSTAPLFFDVSDGQVTEVANPDVNSGLVLELNGRVGHCAS
ncbi:Aste57867_16992 [Aphanomyces stellatus]|uniref:Aste57867_16992 protein n=1 Tax=Aphanomyces stellatus TaxID=120398 RepID=A0A485L6U7_9STRA|nr:hypothetical protein As57867_016934 [Aphanomyces stellatus]VFT93753.1 Aste57867_16992 [Aphanomyces stellatus]